VPKLKTKKSISRRMKLTKTGKVKRRHQMVGHFRCAKSPKRRRKLRQSALVAGKMARTFRQLMRV
jgi:large subunit ribosomal protein L35